MTTVAQRKATSAHRTRAKSKGLVRIEVQAARTDGALIRAVADTLRGDGVKAQSLRTTLEQALSKPNKSILEVIGMDYDISDEVADVVFNHDRSETWRDIEL